MEKLEDLYQVHVVLNTYDLFEYSARARNLLCETWGMKLRGYKSYFPYGVLPIDKYDFISHHLIVTDKRNDRPLMAVRSLAASSCEKCDMSFPVTGHLLNGRERDYPDHALAITDWVEQNMLRNSDMAYSSSFTVEPALPRENKKELVDMVFYLFPYFYGEYQIPNIIHGVNKRNKLDLRQERIGFKKLCFNNHALPHIELQKYDDVQCDIMVMNDLSFGEEHLAESKTVKFLWDQREELIGLDRADSDKKAA